MNRVFFYFSHTGNGDFLAKELEEKGFEIRKINPKKGLPKSFFFSVLIGGFLAGLKVKSKLKPFDDSLEGVDQVLIGSPVWNGRFSAPINGLLPRLNLEGKDVTFLFYGGSPEEPTHAKKRIQKQFPNAKFLYLQEPKKHPESLQKLSSL